MEPKVCIIGAGPCGLTAAKNLLQYDIKSFCVFEKNNQIGGNWVFAEENGHSSVYETTHLISSKRLSSFEDFPMPADYPDYPSHMQVLAYFQSYANHFKILPHIKFNSCVTQVYPYKHSLQWQVVYRNQEGEHQEIFDYVLIANGHHWHPFQPTYPGEFNGEILHSHQYKKALPFKDKRVLVVGAGNSACDIAVEISQIAKKTAISMRKGQHIFPKFVFGKPVDIAFAKINWMPFICRQQIAKIIIRLIQGRYGKYKLQTPDTNPLSTHPTLNSQLMYYIRHGKISTFKGISHFKDNEVHFADGKCDEFDTIILATGYNIHFPFFATDLINFQNSKEIPLYLKMMHPEFTSLYFIGLFQPQGCIWPLADHQAHIIARIIKGHSKRPHNLALKIQKEMQHTRNRFIPSPRHVLEVDYHQFRKQLLKELVYIAQ